MKDNFDFQRFGKLLAFDAKRCISNFGVNFLILCGLPILLWVLSLVFGFTVNPLIRSVVCIGAMSLAVVFFPSRAYGDVNVPRNGVAFAMLPASKLEKFLSMMIYLVVVPVLVLLGSYLIDLLLTVLPWGGFNEFVPLTPFRYLSADFGQYKGVDSALLFKAMINSIRLQIVAGMLFSAAYFLFCNTLFKKRKLALGILILIGINQLLAMFTSMSLSVIVTNSRYSWLLELDSLDSASAVGFVSNMLVVMACLYIAIAIGLFIASYYKLKNTKY